MSRIPSCLPFVLLVASLAMVPRPAAAAWPHDPAVNVPVSTSGAQYITRIAPDGAGGAFVVWQDAAGDIRAQRLSAGGARLWTDAGVGVCTATGSQERPTIAPDGAGGVVIAWQDYRAGQSDIYAQRVSADGAALWTTDGVALSTAADGQRYPVLVADGGGGAIVAWQDYRSGNSDIYARRVSADGVAQGTADGVALCDAALDQTDPVIATDGRGGAIVAWTDWRDFATSYTDIYTQRLSTSDAAAWTDDGVALCTIGQYQDNATIASDGAGGAIVVWRDARTGYEIYAQRVSAAGAPQWAANGVVLGTGSGFRSNPVAAPDLAGGAIVAWYDLRNTYSDIYAQRVSSAGTALWTAGGSPVCTAAGAQAYPRIAADGAGGAIVGWYEDRSGGQDIYAQRLTSAGAALWTADGVPVCTALASQNDVVVATDGAGGAILAWYDERLSWANAYAQRVDRWGYLGAEPGIAGAKDVPNDQGGQVKLSWDASPLENDLLFENIESYRVYRSVPPSATAAALALGAVLEDAGPPALDDVRDRLLVTTQGAQTHYWEYVATVTADHLPGYSYVVPTACDSVEGSNPLTLFLVQARSTGGTMWWNSAPDSGYSVDDLAPAALALFTGEYAAGTSTLHWAVSTAPDLAEYRLYRGTSADFVPGPENLVIAQADTGYADAAGDLCYYKLCAVDVHGNVGPYVTLLPSGTVGVPGPAVPRAVFLAPPAPNPARGAVTLRFGLPGETRVELALYDQQGRRVRSLLAGTQPAGEHALAWDGRDGAGRLLPAGLYFARLEVEGRAYVSRLAVIH